MIVISHKRERERERERERKLLVSDLTHSLDKEAMLFIFYLLFLLFFYFLISESIINRKGIQISRKTCLLNYKLQPIKRKRKKTSLITRKNTMGDKPIPS